MGETFLCWLTHAYITLSPGQGVHVALTFFFFSEASRQLLFHLEVSLLCDFMGHKGINWFPRALLYVSIGLPGHYCIGDWFNRV